MDLVKKIIDLKKEGYNNTQIAKMLNIRRQDIVVILKYLKDKNEDFFLNLEELKKEREKVIQRLEEIKKEKRVYLNEINQLKKMIDLKNQTNETLQNRLEELEKCAEKKEELQLELKELINQYNKKLETIKRNLANDYYEVIEEKNKTIDKLNAKVKKCLVTKCFFFKFLIFSFFILVIGGSSYIFFKYKLYKIKKTTEDFSNYRLICYNLNKVNVHNDISSFGDAKYSFCYYTKK